VQRAEATAKSLLLATQKPEKQMNKFMLLLGTSLLFSACGGNEETVSTDLITNPNTADGVDPSAVMAKITFDKDVHDFGKITQGEMVETSFAFTNTGEADLIISSAKGSCGCTVPEWPKEPIPPGGKGEIRVVFNSEGKSGTQHKQVTIVGNTQPSTSVVALKGEIITPESTTNE
jgi:hypothetical protein